MKKIYQLPSVIAICLYSSLMTTYAQTSINLSQFTFCSVVDPVPNITDDLSGVCYNHDTGTLFVAVNSGSIHELSLTGAHLRQISYGGGFLDIEGIAYMGNNTYALSIETLNEVEIVTIQPAPNNAATFVKSIDTNIPFGIDGIEGIAYNAGADELYVVNEKDVMAIRKISNPSSANPTVSTPFDLEAKAMNYPITDAAGLSFTSFGTLLILSEESQVAYEVNPSTGDLVDFSPFFVGLLEPEGIITVSDQFIVVVGEDSEFQTFLRSGISCPPATTLPTITAHPQSTLDCSGSFVTFSVTATNGDVYQWEQNTGSGFMPLSNGAPFSGATTAMLTIADIAGLDTYQYRCVVTNAMGSVTSNPATLTVLDCGIYDLALIIVELSVGPYFPGDDVTYEITVSNQGNMAANTIEITDYIPTGMTLSTVDVNGWAGGPAGTVTNIIPSIPAAQDMSVQIVLTIDPAFTAGTSQSNNAAITADDGDDVDSDPSVLSMLDDYADDDDLTESDGGDDEDPELIMVQGTPEISLIKSGTFNDENGNGCAEVGETISYTFELENTGNTVLTDVTIIDPLVTVLGGPLSILAPGQIDNTSFTGNYTLIQTDLDVEVVINSALAVGTAPDGDIIEDSDEDEIDLIVGSDPDQDGITDCSDLCPNDRDVSLHFENRGEQSGNTSDYVEIPHDADFNLTSGHFAFEAWVNPTSGADTRAIITKGSGFGSTSSFLFDIMSDDGAFWGEPGKLGLFLFSGNNVEGEFSESSIPLDVWTHVAVSVDNSGTNPVATFYINGVMDGVRTFTFLTSALNNTDTDPVLIGRQGSTTQTNHFEGQMDELAVWSKTLTTTDVLNSMAGPYVGSEAGLVAYYDFNDNDACVANGSTTLVDKANGHNGTLINFALSSTCESNWAAGHNQGACEAVCLPALNLTSTQTQSAHYESGGYISSDQMIVSPAQVDYDASTMITLQENFEVKLGTIFHAYINGCTAGTPQEYLDAGFNVAYLLNAGYTVQDLIGLNHNGGIIFYIDVSNGSGLIAAPMDQANAEWGCLGTNVLGANGTAIGTGAQNTIDILNGGCSIAADAANLCTDLSLNGYNDWFLPSIDALNQLYLNRAIVGGFSTGLYWSSSEYDIANEDEKALAISFIVGTSSTRRKLLSLAVRAIRAF